MRYIYENIYTNIKTLIFNIYFSKKFLSINLLVLSIPNKN